MKNKDNEVVVRLKSFKELIQKAEEDFKNLKIGSFYSEYQFFSTANIKRYFFRKEYPYSLTHAVHSLSTSLDVNKNFAHYFEKIEIFHRVVLERFADHSSAKKAELFYSDSNNHQIMIRSKSKNDTVDYIEQEPNTIISRFFKRINVWLTISFFMPIIFLLFSQHQTIREYLHDFWTYVFICSFVVVIVHVFLVYKEIKKSKIEAYKNIEGKVFSGSYVGDKEYEFGFHHNHPELHTNTINNVIELIFRLGQQYKESKVYMYWGGLYLSKLYFEKEMTIQKFGRPQFNNRIKKHQIDVVSRWEGPLMFTLEIPEYDIELVFFLKTGSDPQKSV